MGAPDNDIALFEANRRVMELEDQLRTVEMACVPFISHAAKLKDPVLDRCAVVLEQAIYINLANNNAQNDQPFC